MHYCFLAYIHQFTINLQFYVQDEKYPCASTRKALLILLVHKMYARWCIGIFQSQIISLLSVQKRLSPVMPINNRNACSREANKSDSMTQTLLIENSVLSTRRVKNILLSPVKVIRLVELERREFYDVNKRVSV